MKIDEHGGSSKVVLVLASSEVTPPVAFPQADVCESVFDGDSPTKPSATVRRALEHAPLRLEGLFGGDA